MKTIIMLVTAWIIFDVGCLVGGLFTLKRLGYSVPALLRSRWVSLKARLGFKPPPPPELPRYSDLVRHDPHEYDGCCDYDYEHDND